MRIFIIFFVLSTLFISCKDEDETLFDVMYRVKGTSRYHKITYKDSEGNNVVKDSVRDHWEYGFFSKKDAPIFLEAQNLDTTGTITATVSINGKILDSKTEVAPLGVVKVEGVAK